MLWVATHGCSNLCWYVEPQANVVLQQLLRQLQHALKWHKAVQAASRLFAWPSYDHICVSDC